MIQFIRKQYMDGECTHRQYYAQFVNEHIKGMVETCIGTDKVLHSTDKHLNDIPLEKWDMLAIRMPPEVSKLLKEAGDYKTQAGDVCILKEAAHQIKEEICNRQK